MDDITISFILFILVGILSLYSVFFIHYYPPLTSNVAGLGYGAITYNQNVIQKTKKQKKKEPKSLSTKVKFIKLITEKKNMNLSISEFEVIDKQNVNHALSANVRQSTTRDFNEDKYGAKNAIDGIKPEFNVNLGIVETKNYQETRPSAREKSYLLFELENELQLDDIKHIRIYPRSDAYIEELSMATVELLDNVENTIQNYQLGQYSDYINTPILIDFTEDPVYIGFA